jgi:ABC-2 type transport system permease protein
MNMIRLLLRAIKNNFHANLANPTELLSGIFAMVANNIIYFGGVALVLFGGGRAADLENLKYYLAMQTVLFVSFGGVCFFAGGFRRLPSIIESGEFDVYLAQPRSPLLLAGLSRSLVSSAGDVVQGVVMWFVLGYLYGPFFMFQTIYATILSIIGCLAFFILCGSAALFIQRGSSVADLLFNAVMIPAGWPIGPKLLSWERIILNLTPLGIFILLPMDVIESHSPLAWSVATVSVVVGFVVSIAIFNSGKKRYQGNSFFQLK